MAEKNRRGEDDANDRLDDEAVDDRIDDPAEDDDREPVSGGGTATRTKAESTESQPKSKSETGRVGIFGRVGRFFREVVAELRKVIWPTRKELLTYTTVVVVFIAVMTSIVVLLDYGFARAMLWVFGNPS
nr:preprotein translocase subunit SecE [Micromonospora sp. DSM 115978]